MFTHCPPKELPNLESVTQADGKRYYVTPNGKRLPSVTTVVGAKKKQVIMEWRKRVGEEEANRVSLHATTGGTALHKVCERYLDNEEDYFGNAMPHVRGMFNSIKHILDERIGVVYMQEVPLYSKHLRLAGRVDVIAEFDGVPSIIDFKTSKRTKTEEDIKDYFEQEAAYAVMYEERTKRTTCEHRAHGLPTQARARSTGRALRAHLRTNMLKPEST